jgi:hypothetical protein
VVATRPAHDRGRREAPKAVRRLSIRGRGSVTERASEGSEGKHGIIGALSHHTRPPRTALLCCAELDHRLTIALSALAADRVVKIDLFLFWERLAIVDAPRIHPDYLRLVPNDMQTASS